MGIDIDASADHDAAIAEKGVHHEDEADTDWSGSGVVEKGYATTLADLIFYAPFDEDSGDVNDIVGDNVATKINSPTQGVNGILGTNAIDFDNANDEALNWGNIVSPANISVSVWFKVDSTFAFTKLLSKGDFGNDEGWVLEMGSSGSTVAWGVGNGTGNVYMQSASGFDDGAWHHAFGTYDGSEAVLYVDASEENSSTGISGDIAYSATNDDFRIGEASNAAGNVDATIDEAMVFSAGKGSSFVTELYETAL